MVTDDRTWELRVIRECVQQSGSHQRTYGTYQVYVNKLPIDGLAGHVCECVGPGDNSHPKSGKRIKAGRYPLSTQFGKKYEIIDYSTDEKRPGRHPMPGILVGNTGKRTGILIHPAHPPKLYLSSIGCLNPSGALGPSDKVDFWDSRARVIALIKSLKSFAPEVFLQRRNTSIPNAFIVIEGEPIPVSGRVVEIDADLLTSPYGKLPSVDVLTERLAFCIGIWETNRGGDAPEPKESTLETVSGFHASMATINQSTMPFAIDVIMKFQELRKIATPALTGEDLDEANRCCREVVRLLASVNKARLCGVSEEVFISKNSREIDEAYLSQPDIYTMFAAVDLKAKIDELHTEIVAKSLTLSKAVKSIPRDERLGLGTSSLRAYLKRPSIWGENRAAWQRKSVGAMPNRIGERIEFIATSNDGASLVMPLVRSHILEELAASPGIDEKTLVIRVATRNNPGEANYGKNVFGVYARLYSKKGISQLPRTT